MSKAKKGPNPTATVLRTGPSSNPSTSTQPDLALMVLSKKMFKDKLMSCASCESHLIPPIWLHQHLGNICDQCWVSVAGISLGNESALQNKTLELVFAQLYRPCKYSVDGCKEFLLSPQLEEHEGICKNLKISCMKSCTWKRQMPFQFLNHFKKKHPEDVVSFEKRNCVFNMPINNDGEVVKLLLNEQRPLFLTINKNIATGTIHFKMFHAKHDVMENAAASVTLVGLTSNDIDMLMNIHVLNNFNDSTGDAVLMLETIKNITGAHEFISVSIEMLDDPNKSMIDVQVQKEIQAHFECPICTEIMRPPIYQCDTGHSICSSCKNKITTCPSCLKTFSNSATRNFAMEALTETLVYDSLVRDKKSSSKHPCDEGTSLNIKKKDTEKFSICIDNLNKSVTNRIFRDLIKDYGGFEKLYLAKNKKDGSCLGFAIVHYKVRKDAVRAIEKLNGQVFHGLSLSVDRTETKHKK